MQKEIFKILMTVVVALLSCGRAMCADTIPDGQILSNGHVKAMVVADASQLLGGVGVKGRVGDFKIYNSAVGFVIAGVRPASGMDPYGGVVVEAGRIIDDRLMNRRTWANLMGYAFPAFYSGGNPLMSARLFNPVTAKIVKDGSDGEAVVRVEGTDAEFPTRREFFKMPSKSMGLNVAIDYILKADSTALEIKLTLINKSERDRTVSLGQLFLMGDGADPFIPVCGVDKGCFMGKETPLVAASGQGVSYGWFSPGAVLSVFEQIENLMLVSVDKLKAPAGGEASNISYLAVADGGVSPAFAKMYELAGNKNYGTVEGRIHFEVLSGQPGPSGISVHVLSVDGKYLNEAEASPQGEFEIAMPPGEYILQAAAWERNDPEPVKVTVAKGQQADVDINIGEPSYLIYEVKDGAGKLIPATVSFVPVGQKTPAVADAKFALPVRYGGYYYKIDFSGDGRGKVAVRPGKYEVYFSRGPEYEIVKKEVNLEEGKSEHMNVVLAHSVDAAGWVCGDFHMHTGTSHDADDSPFDSVRAYAALGIEVPVSTDHDRLTDYTPYIKADGLQTEEKSIVGQEITTKRMGHFNAFPLVYKPDAQNEGAIDWMEKTIPEMLAEVRKNSDRKIVIQMNHPRDPMYGNLNAVGYDPATGQTRDPKNFSLDFDAIEVLNSALYSQTEKVKKDWYGFLNSGKRVTATGNSDNHMIMSLGQGYPRDCVKSATDKPADVNEDDFINAVLKQQLVVVGGPFITFGIDSKAGMGETVTDTDGSVDLNIEVQAPSWMDVTKMTIVANGEEIQTVPLAPAPTPVRYKGTITVKPEKDTWYVVRVEGEKPLFPVYPYAHAYSFTNPIYVDVDGNGKFDPPEKQAQ